jgi:hypothetical protein
LNEYQSTRGKFGVKAQTLSAPAVDRRIDGDTLTLLRAIGGHAREFVVQKDRLLKASIADSRVDKPVQIRAADANSGNPDRRFSEGGSRFFLVVEL